MLMSTAGERYRYPLQSSAIGPVSMQYLPTCVKDVHTCLSTFDSVPRAFDAGGDALEGAQERAGRDGLEAVLHVPE